MPRRIHRLHHTIERHITPIERTQIRIPHPHQQLTERHTTTNITPQSNGIHEKPDNLLQPLPPTRRHRTPHHHIRTRPRLRQHRHQRRMHHHVHTRPHTPRQPPHPRMTPTRPPPDKPLPPHHRHIRPHPIQRHPRLHRHTTQKPPPKTHTTALGTSRGSVVHAPLPGAEVRELERWAGRGFESRIEPGRVGLRELRRQPVDGPVVDDHVVQAEQDRRRGVRCGEDADAPRGPGLQVEGLPGGFRYRGGQVLSVDGKNGVIRGVLLRRKDLLSRGTVHGREAGAQDVVAGGQVLQRPAQSFRVQVAVHLPGPGHVVVRAAARQSLQQPEPFLLVGEEERLVA